MAHVQSKQQNKVAIPWPYMLEVELKLVMAWQALYNCVHFHVLGMHVHLHIATGIEDCMYNHALQTGWTT